MVKSETKLHRIDKSRLETAQKAIDFHNSQLRAIRNGRKEIDFKVIDAWFAWKNSFIAVSFGVAGVLSGLLTVVDYDQRWQYVLMVLGINFIAFVALYLLLKTKVWLEDNSIASSDLLYEEEYYATVIKDSVEKARDIGLTDDELAILKEAEVALMNRASENLQTLDERSKKIDHSMDTAVIFFVAGTLLIGLSAISDAMLAKQVGTGALILWILLLFFIRHRTKLFMTSIGNRDEWKRKKKEWQERNQTT